VFVPVLLLTGTARYLFTPLAMAVVFAMLASYLLSRTLVPTMMAFLLESRAGLYQEGADGEPVGGRGLFWSAHHLFNASFREAALSLRRLLDWSLAHRGRVLRPSCGFPLASLGLVWLVGEDFFPAVDSGQMRLHARAPAGTRIEETEVAVFAALEREIRDVIPADESIC
jgi:multidrug efflux pump subunit AcrB